MYTYTLINGQRVETAVARAYAALAAEFKRVWGLDLLISSGVRTNSEQWVLYNAWVAYQNGTGPKANLAAKPPNSNHEEDGPIGPRAADVRDSGADAGVTVVGTPRSNWLRDNAPRLGFKNTGLTFNPREAWHIEYQGDLDNGQVAGGQVGIDVDGIWGAATTAKLQSVLGVKVDSQLGPETITALQRGLGLVGADLDGILGPKTVGLLQAKVGAHVDGILGKDTVTALQIWLNKGYGFTPDNGQLQVDGQWGPATTRKFQHSLGVDEDSILGPDTWKAFQAAVGFTGTDVDGQPGKQTISALQTNVGAEVDGVLGSGTITKLQEFLNAGKTWTKITVPPAIVLPAAVAREPECPLYVRAWLPPYAYSIKTGKLNERPAGVTITRGINHHTGTTSDQEEFFKTANSRISCPHVYLNVAGELIGFIPLHLQPSSTGSANPYSIAIEVQDAGDGPTWLINDVQHEALAKFWAWVVLQPEFSGVTVEIVPDRSHIIGHNEAGVNSTTCPGPSMNLNRVVARVLELNHVDPPIEPPVDPPTLNEKIKALYAELGTLINELE